MNQGIFRDLYQFALLVSYNQAMRTNGYLEHLDLGIDPDSGQPNILVCSFREYHELTDEEKARSWATIKVASEISERVAVTLYQQAYSGKISNKIIKKNPWDRRGLTLVKVPENIKTKEDRRKEDIARMVRVVRRTLRATSWLPEAHQILITGVVDNGLRSIEQELFGSQEAKEAAKNSYYHKLTAKEGDSDEGNNKQ